MNLPNYRIYLKLMVGGVTSQPFSAVTLPLPKQAISESSEIVNESRRQHAKERGEVEQNILVRSKSEIKLKNAQENLL